MDNIRLDDTESYEFYHELLSDQDVLPGLAFILSDYCLS